MQKLKRESIRKTTEEFIEAIRSPISKTDTSFKQVVSTGSTLLDLAISGKRVKGGGIPGGIIVEIFGPSSSGKTAILTEICASAQNRGGDVMFLDPEARLDQEYCKIYGLSLPEEKYFRPDTVREMFEKIYEWKPKENGVINVIGADSLAALSTEMEMEEKDKMGMKRAKEFSEGLRKICRIIANNNWLVVCTNQIREGQRGEFTPGGKGISFYSSVRIKVAQKGKISVTKSLKDRNKKIEKVIGIHSLCHIKKSSVDDPFRSSPIDIVFGFGVDDVRANLQYLKDMNGLNKYEFLDGSYVSMEKMIRYIETNKLQDKLRDAVIDKWEEIENLFVMGREPKIRR